MTKSAVTVLGATGPVGRAVVARLADAGVEVTAVGRNAAALENVTGAMHRAVADCNDASAMRAALTGATRIVSCLSPGFVPHVVAALPSSGVERLVVLASTRRFSAIPDATAEASRVAETLLAGAGVPAVLLLSTQIYGTGRGVVSEIEARLRRSRFLPMAGGGKALVQPIHVQDLAAAAMAALFAEEAPGAPIVVAGPKPLRWRTLALRVALTRGLALTVLPVPSFTIALARRLAPARFQGMLASLARQLEDQSADIGPMRERLGVVPQPFEP